MVEGTDLMNGATPLAVAEGISNYGVLIVIAGFFLSICGVMMFFVVRSFMKMTNRLTENKEKDIETLKVLSNINNALIRMDEADKEDRKINSETNSIVKRIDDNEQGYNINCVDAISEWVFDNACYELVRILDNIIKDNNIKDNEKFIEQKVTRLIDNMHSKRQVKLDLFKFEGRKLSEFVDKNWCDIMIQTVMEEIYVSDSFNRGRAITNIRIMFDDIKMQFYSNIKNKVY
jgi:hypothetical protein